MKNMKDTLSGFSYGCCAVAAINVGYALHAGNRSILIPAFIGCGLALVTRIGAMLPEKRHKTQPPGHTSKGP